MSRPDEKRQAIKNLSALARKHTEKALEVLVKNMDADDPRVAIDAASRLLDRGYGKPAQTIEGDEDSPVQVSLRVKWDDGSDNSNPVHT
jgi:hypothetical protein